MLFQEVDSISSVVQSCLKHCYDRTGAEFLFFSSSKLTAGHAELWGGNSALNSSSLLTSTHRILNI